MKEATCVCCGKRVSLNHAMEIALTNKTCDPQINPNEV